MNKIGIIKSQLDAHTLGISAVRSLIEESGYAVLVAPEEISEILAFLPEKTAVDRLRDWLVFNEISGLGCTYRLDPGAGVRLFDKVYSAVVALKKEGVCLELRLFFAGLPDAVELIKQKYGRSVTTFNGDETPIETLVKLNIDPKKIPSWLSEESRFDSNRFQLASDLIDDQSYVDSRENSLPNLCRTGSLGARLKAIKQVKGRTLCRAHAGPYFDDIEFSLAIFDQWVRELSKSGELDILSIGTSQLTQQAFGEVWGATPNGGGVPINSEFEFKAVKHAAGDMLVRSYSGTNKVPEYSQMLNRTIDCAWHALSIWWFNQVDGRGPLSLKQTISQHLETLKLLAKANKPFEPNVGHHFAFRGADEVTSIVATVLAVRMAVKLGVKDIILQVMLNTPKMTSGVSDIVKYRALMNALNAFQDTSNVNIIPQPRAGLAYFSPDLQKAKVQLASVSGLMTMLDEQRRLPPIVHVVGFSEASHLAGPDVIDESVKITRKAIRDFSKLESSEIGLTEDVIQDLESKIRQLTTEILTMVQHIEKHIPNLWSVEGLYQVYRRGYFAVPDMWCCRDELELATIWNTRVCEGAMRVVDDNGKPITMNERLSKIEEAHAKSYG